MRPARARSCPGQLPQRNRIRHSRASFPTALSVSEQELPIPPHRVQVGMADHSACITGDRYMNPSNANICRALTTALSCQQLLNSTCTSRTAPASSGTRALATDPTCKPTNSDASSPHAGGDPRASAKQAAAQPAPPRCDRALRPKSRRARKNGRTAALGLVSAREEITPQHPQSPRPPLTAGRTDVSTFPENREELDAR